MISLFKKIINKLDNTNQFHNDANIDFISPSYHISKEMIADLYHWPLDFAIHTSVPNGVKGDYWEFGVYQGRSFIRAYNTFRSLNSLNRRFIGFDSFFGLPKSDEAHKPEQYFEGAYACSEDEFVYNLRSAKLDLDKVIVIPGFYDQSLKSFATKEKLVNSKIAVVYIDCDIYESARDVFSFIEDYLQDGSILVMDDWFRHLGIPSFGIQKAFYEWIDKSKWKFVELAKTKKIAFIVYR